MPFDHRGYLDRVSFGRGQRVRNGHNGNFLAVSICLQRKDDCDRPIFDALVPPGLMFVRP